MSGLNKIAILLTSLCIFGFTHLQGASAETISSRLAGNDRYQTAIAASQCGWPQGASTAVLTTGENYPDALSAAPLAAKYKAPILLVNSSGMGAETASELKRLNTKKVYIIGGTGVIPKSVESQLRLAGISAVRLAGQDRYDTALEVAKTVGTSKGVFVTSGESFADSLSAAPIAAGQGMPILLVPRDGLTPNEKNFIAKAKLKRIVIVGSENEVSATVQNQLPGSERIDGENAYDRNVALLKSFEDTLNRDKIYVATGENFPDALSASALAQRNMNGVLLIQGNTIPTSVQDYLGSRIIGHIEIMGGEGVILPATEYNLAGMTARVVQLEEMTVRVQEKQTYDLPKTVSVKTNNGNWTEAPVTWDLASVSTEKAGTYTYSGTISGYSGEVKLCLIVEPILNKVETITAEVIQGSTYTLPDKVKVMLSDESYKMLPVKWTTNPSVSNLSKIGTYTFQGTVEGTKLTANLKLIVSEDSAIKFNDKALEWCVKDALGRQSSTQPVYRSDVLSITSLDASGHSIRNLTGLEAFTNLISLDLSQNRYLKGADLAPLQKLTNLQSLNLAYNDLEKIDSLKNITSLSSLDISNNRISDFSPLKGLTQLTSLYLIGNSSEDYSSTRLYYNQLAQKDFILDSGSGEYLVPANIVANASSDHQIDLRWNLVNNATSYNVYRSTSYDGIYSKIDSVSTPYYTDIYVSPGITYYYKIQGVNPPNVGDYSRIVYATTKSNSIVLSAPENLAATPLPDRKIYLTWNNVMNGISYNVYRRTADSGIYTILATVNTPYYTDESVVPGITYDYKVQAANTSGTGPYSSAVTATVSSK
ncbi:cell wall-binding repeat-containing protein [Desulfitobacterium sp.]|uniref:cell wall-binding repeat-containing protein n=1 Tax=Desulfitobacterium sp. TaxID=49981 RepID=UPI002B21DA6F|nr:cell wall-binding repeat-containing protein [Desulfitobacterium sp.]MEA4902195.1 cell wall-binding repeat-containing protein [Desulfitobacterium sp.]